MSIGTLYTIDYQPKGRGIRAAAAFGGLTVDIPSDYKHFETNKEAPFLSKFPHGKIPAFDGKDGLKLFEGYPIARYIASLAPNSGLLGTSAGEAAQVDAWTHLVESEIDSRTDVVNAITSGRIAYSKPMHTAALELQARALNTLEKHLAANTFFVGERITLADLFIAALIQRSVKLTIDAAVRATIPNVIRHLETIVNQPKLKEVYGPIEYIEKGIQFVPPKKEKESKPAAAAAPKAEKKPKAKDDDEEEPDVPPEPKAKNPLDDLPKSSFNLEDWKRAYSNKDTRGAGGSLEWLYQNLDKEGFSLWRVDFKYNKELTQTFMSSNQITGFFNRLEASRKYLFGSVGVLGKTNDSIISGALILRGQDVEPVVNVAPDWESYSYSRIDLNDAAQKEFFEGALAWDLKVDGKEWVDGKNFK
ncbi:elongation factor 1-gamma [Dendrothele bispora CBS 962.96]|uniref:Elongation factor 1-gamma n=1 Tax=Dendrothele bispora (strain CBS 962.96) TaxID=1314807 RepID=A0A4S8LX68_DENBC|nr:elongation factor 1-gamma [Dendrothele bispora CBS 962.96]